MNKAKNIFYEKVDKKRKLKKEVYRVQVLRVIWNYMKQNYHQY